MLPNDTKTLVQKSVFPLNVEGFDQVKLNDILFAKLHKSAKDNDRKLRATNWYLLKGLGPLFIAWNDIISLEINLIIRDPDANPGIILDLGHEMSLNLID